MMSSSVCPLPKSRKWKKTFRDTGIIATVMLMFRHFVIVCRATWNGRICGNNLSQVNYTQSYAPEATVWLTLFFIIGLLTAWHPWIVKNFGQTIERKSPWRWLLWRCSYYGFGDSDDEESEDIGDNHWAKPYLHKRVKACKSLQNHICESLWKYMHFARAKTCERCIYC